MEIQKTSNSQSNLEKEEWDWRNQPAQLHRAQMGASLVAQTVRICLTMQEIQFLSLGLEDSLEKRMATPSSILA